MDSYDYERFVFLQYPIIKTYLQRGTLSKTDMNELHPTTIHCPFVNAKRT